MTSAQNLNGTELEFLKHLAKGIDTERVERLECLVLKSNRANWDTVCDMKTLLLEINSCLVVEQQNRE